MLNGIWLGLLTVAALLAGVTGRLGGMTDGAIQGANAAVTVSLGLIGVMALWLGVLRLAEQAGLVTTLARILQPFLGRLFPEVPPGHPALGSMVLNITANALGLTNAATPMGLRAMKDLQRLNPNPDSATNAMCTFLAINTGSVQLIPVTAIAVLAANGSKNPTWIVGTTLLATVCSSLTGLLVVKTTQGLRWFRPTETPIPPSNASLDSPTAIVSEAAIESVAPAAPRPLGWGGRCGLMLLVLSFAAFAVEATLHPPAGSEAGLQSGPIALRALNALSLVALPFLLVSIPVYAAFRGLAVHEHFVAGAKEGFETAVRIIPYLVAMLVAIGCLRGAGGIEGFTRWLEPLLNSVGYPPELVPMTLLRPLTGSGTLAAFTDLVKTHGADSLLARMGGTLFGSTETTFYVIAVYFGSIGIRRTRHAVLAGLAADLAGAIAAVAICRAMA
jgi:spore maturation protein SpmA